MIEFEKEYFNKPYYFFLKDRGNKISLHYSVSENLNEAKKEDNKMDFPKKEEKNVKKQIFTLTIYKLTLKHLVKKNLSTFN